MKNAFFTILVIFLFVVLPLSCSNDGPEAGVCTLSCGGLQGPVNTVKTIRTTESKCREMAADSENSNCAIGYCPPTGNEEDCIRLR